MSAGMRVQTINPRRRTPAHRLLRFRTSRVAVAGTGPRWHHAFAIPSAPVESVRPRIREFAEGSPSGIESGIDVDGLGSCFAG